jgi:hypothetical protein
VAPPPATASAVSGRVYRISESNPLDLRSVSFTFGTEAAVRLETGAEVLTIPIGLDGRYRIAAERGIGGRGEWTSGMDFRLDINTIAGINRLAIDARFDGQGVGLVLNEATGLLRNVRLSGK